MSRRTVGNDRSPRRPVAGAMAGVMSGVMSGAMAGAMARTMVMTVVIGMSVAAAGPALAGTAPPGQARSQGARWLVAHQNDDGGWGAGSWGGSAGAAASDVATTSLAVMALLRDANGRALHREAIARGVGFVVRAVEASPSEGARLQGPQGTQPQYKLGRNVDTHFAALLLGEISRRLQTGEALGLAPADEHGVAVAYDKVLSKVVAAQKADGSFDGDGWAPVLSTSVAARSLYQAQALGKTIAPETLERSDAYQRKLVDADTGALDASAGAGVDLYAAASSLQSNRDAARRTGGEARVRAEKAAEATADAVRARGDALAAGFGSVGGEEMLSYMMISDTLAESGGDDWDAWNRRIAERLSATQNADGSWSGHHCITSTTFVTAAAVMTLGSEDAVGNRVATR